jgi:hypothetical protein
LLQIPIARPLKTAYNTNQKPSHNITNTLCGGNDLGMGKRGFRVNAGSEISGAGYPQHFYSSMPSGYYFWHS